MALVGGCEKEEEPPPKEETLAPDAFCALVMGAAQRSLEGACTGAEQKEDAYRYLTELAKERIAECSRSLDSDHKSERLVLPAAKARDCAAALEKHSWKDLLQMRSIAFVSECRDVIVGKQQRDQPCRIDAACASGHFCSGARDGVEGRCQALGKAKEACEPRTALERATCAEGLRCVVDRVNLRHPLGIDALEPAQPVTETDADAGVRGQALREAREFGLIGLLNTSTADARWHGLDRIVRGLKGEVDPGTIGLGNIGFGMGSRGSGLVLRDVSVTGKLQPDVVKRIVRQHFGRIRLCYERLQDVRGRLTVRFEIDDAGSPRHVAASGDIKDRGIIGCVERAVAGINFPQPQGATTARLALDYLPTNAQAAPPADRTCHPPPKSCRHDGDCADGASCKAGACSRELAPKGDKCDDSTDCAAGFYCKLQSEGGTCAPRKKNGTECSGSLQCTGICGKDEKCASFCDGR